MKFKRSVLCCRGSTTPKPIECRQLTKRSLRLAPHCAYSTFLVRATEPSPAITWITTPIGICLFVHALLLNKYMRNLRFFISSLKKTSLLMPSYSLSNSKKLTEDHRFYDCQKKTKNHELDAKRTFVLKSRKSCVSGRFWAK